MSTLVKVRNIEGIISFSIKTVDYHFLIVYRIFSFICVVFKQCRVVMCVMVVVSSNVLNQLIFISGGTSAVCIYTSKSLTLVFFLESEIQIKDKIYIPLISKIYSSIYQAWLKVLYDKVFESVIISSFPSP